MNEESLEKLVTRDQLLEKHFREHHGIMVKIWRDYEIKYVKVKKDMYSLDRILHLRDRYIGEEYEG